MFYLSYFSLSETAKYMLKHPWNSINKLSPLSCIDFLLEGENALWISLGNIFMELFDYVTYYLIKKRALFAFI